MGFCPILNLQGCKEPFLIEFNNIGGRKISSRKTKKKEKEYETCKKKIKQREK